jgi:hypothetical protein
MASEPGDVAGLRRFILGLAIRGDLDDAATRVERTGATEYSIGSDVSLLAGHTNVRPLATVAHLKKGLTPIRQAVPGEYPFVVTADARSSSDHYDFEGPAAIIPLVSSSGHGNASIKRLHYQEGRFAVGTILCAVFPRDPALLSARFLYEYLSAFKDELLVSRMVGTANVTLTLAKIAEVPIPLISRAAVERLGTLMSLCDELEAAQTERETRRDRLRTAALENLIAAHESTDSARFFVRHSPRMITKPEHVAGVRQAIYDLAVQGRLVQQDPEDEPALVWLRRLTNQMSRGTVDDASMSPHLEGAETPPGWGTVKLNDVAPKVTSGSRAIVKTCGSAFHAAC